MTTNARKDPLNPPPHLRGSPSRSTSPAPQCAWSRSFPS